MAAKVTFGPMAQYDVDGGGEADIFVERRRVGTILKEMDDVSTGMNREYRVIAYVVDLDIDGVTYTNVCFPVRERNRSGRGYREIANALTVLAGARAWIREVVSKRAKE